MSQLTVSKSTSTHLHFVLHFAVFLFFQNIVKSVVQGFVDSIRGTAVVFYLDKEVNKKNQSQSAYQQQFHANDSSTNLRSRNLKNDTAKKQPE